MKLEGIISGFGQNASEIHVLLFSNFMSIPFDYPIISWVMKYVRNRGFLTCLSWFYRIWRSRTPAVITQV